MTLIAGTLPLLLLVLTVNGAIVVIRFDEGNLAFATTVNEFYNGGTNSDGETGPNVGVSFLPTNDWQVGTDFGETSEPGFTFSLSGNGFLNVPGGFVDGFSLNYGAFSDTFLQIFDGLDGTGNLLASATLAQNDPFAFSPFGISFSGVALSIVIAGGGSQFGFDDFTFGSAVVGGGPPVGGARGDPHLSGPNGIKYNFDGQPNGIYNFFSAPQFQINAHLAGDGPTVRFMTEIGVTFRNVTMRFGVNQYAPKMIDRLKTELAAHGAKLSHQGGQIFLKLCPGLVIAITQMHANKKLRPLMVHDDGSTFYFVNVEVQVPHCDDAFDGALGQSYKCEYFLQHKKFKFDHATEESFRVNSLRWTSDIFDVDATCVAPSVPHAANMSNRTHFK
jgi:hypothetical protein